MDQRDSALTAGVRAGSVTSTHEILVLLCYIIDKAKQPVSFDQLNEALQKQELVNYFEFADIMERMCKKGYVERSGDEDERIYTITELGKKTSEDCNYNLPAAVLERGYAALENILTRIRREKENRVTIEKCQDGYTITMAITDRGTEMMRIAVLMPDRASCDEMRRRFLNDPVYVYKTVFNSIMGDSSAVGEAVSSNINLFE